MDHDIFLNNKKKKKSRRKKTFFLGFLVHAAENCKRMKKKVCFKQRGLIHLYIYPSSFNY